MGTGPPTADATVLAAQADERRKLDRKTRKALARRLQSALLADKLSVGQMQALLSTNEAGVLAALRALGARRRSGLRSGMRDGRACWWWEEAPDPVPGVSG